MSAIRGAFFRSIKELKPRDLVWLLILIGLSLSLALVSNNFSNLVGWMSFLAVLVISYGFIIVGWRSIRAESPPRWLLRLVFAAAILRLVLGAVWFAALPVWGYDTPVEQAGYVMKDAFQRDTAAWELSQSSEPLTAAFQEYSYTDQYGGLLFLSGGIYRYLGSQVHQPLLVIVFAAAFSGLAVLYVWAFLNRVWQSRSAKWGAWGLAFYPEAVLLGSSQMREAFTVTLSVMTAYVLVRIWESPSSRKLIGLVGILGFSAVLSFPYAFLLVTFGLALSIVLYRRNNAPIKWGRALLAVGILVGILVVYWFVENYNLVFYIAEWQKHLSERASGKLVAIFNRTPQWTHLPFLVTYGVFRPLLPPAIFDPAQPLWQVVAIWRASGWTVLLLLLIYATFLAIKDGYWKKIPGALILLTWLVILVASVRGGGDQWDNPRYRVAFAGIQVILAAWVVVHQKNSRDPWLRRGIAAAVFMIIWFLPWYFQRKLFDIGWPMNDLPNHLLLGFVSWGVYLLYDFTKELSRDN